MGGNSLLWLGAAHLEDNIGVNIWSDLVLFFVIKQLHNNNNYKDNNNKVLTFLILSRILTKIDSKK